MNLELTKFKNPPASSRGEYVKPWWMPWVVRLAFTSPKRLAYDLDGADVLLPELVADTLLADKAYDADEGVIDRLSAQGKTAVVPSKRNRTTPRDDDKDLYRARHLMPELFCQTQAVSGDRHALRQMPSPSSIQQCQIAGLRV